MEFGKRTVKMASRTYFFFFMIPLGGILIVDYHFFWNAFEYHTPMGKIV